jgi:glutathione-specific gamma-glutamylcyclotransferase
MADKPFPDWWSDEQRSESLAAFLADPARPNDMWVFGYGSLLWKPAFQSLEQRQGVLRGYHREFCILVKRIRGSEEAPGLMMALDRGGECGGVALRLDPKTAEADLAELWKREMVSDIYTPRWATIFPLEADAAPITALAFVANESHGRYARRSEGDAAAMIATAAGSAGACADYLFETASRLAELGIHDANIDRLCTLVKAAKATVP